MSACEISKLDAAGHQLDRAIRLLHKEDDSICADTLSHAAYRVLRELLDIDQAQLMTSLEKAVKVGKLSAFLKHAKNDQRPSLGITPPRPSFALAIMLWTEHGKEQTAAMNWFPTPPDPYESGYRRSAALKLTERQGPISETQLEYILNRPST